jgi:hypothetical protein
MMGAVVFLIVFIVGLGITLASPSIPPGMDIYLMLNVPTVDYPVLGIPATTLVAAVFNGVIYGVIVWLAYSVISAVTGKGKKEQQVQQTVTVQTGAPEKKTSNQT